jgi:hypothetical protein
MNTSLLWQLLSALSPFEIKSFEQWLVSPFHNRRTQPIQLFHYLKNCLSQKSTPIQKDALDWLQKTTVPSITEEKRGRPRLQKVSNRPSDQDDATHLRLLMTELLKLLEAYLVYQQREKDIVTFQFRLATVYREKGLDKHFEKTIESAKNANQKQPFRHSAYFDAEAELSFEWYQYAGNQRKTEQLNLQELSTQTDIAYIARKLRQACLALAYQTVYKSDYDTGLLLAVIEHVKHSPDLLEIPAVALYYYCYLLFTAPQANDFFVDFKTMLIARQGELPTEEQRNLHLLGINYCIYKINQLDKQYAKEALDLYQSGLENNLLLENGILSHMAFNNIVSISLKIGQIQWVSLFISEYGQFLEKKLRDSTIQMNLARIQHTQRNYTEALGHLAQFESKDQANNLLARSLQLKIYYEMNDFDALELHLQSMRVFIRRQRVIGYHKNNYLNIIKFTQKLMSHNPNDKAERVALKQRIEAEERLTEKEWFLEMLR